MADEQKADIASGVAKRCKEFNLWCMYYKPNDNNSLLQSIKTKIKKTLTPQRLPRYVFL